MLKSILKVIISITIVTFLYSQNNRNEELLETFHSISSHNLYDYVKELSSEKYKGRLAGAPEYMDAAKYCADLFKNWGIEPLGDNGSYFQYFNRPYCEVNSTGKVIIKGLNNGNDKILVPKEDYFPGNNSGNGSINAEIVFAGYGICAPELNYDDFQNVDVKDKIVLIESDVPYKGKDNETIKKWASYSSTQTKFETLYKKGARGVLYIGKVANPGAPYFKDLIYVHIDKSVAEEIFNKSNKSFKDIFDRIKKDIKPESFATGITAEISADTKYINNAPTCNVIGIIPGTDPELGKETLILGGHLDGQGHIGFLLPSALDNASGAACILGTAKALSQFKGKMKRSIVFVLFGGEECGLLGAKLFCEKPKVDKEKNVFALNLDMLGNGKDFYLWNAASFPELLKHFNDANDNFIHRPMKAGEYKKSYGRPRSDGQVLIADGYRTLGIFSMTSVYPVYYHDPRDTYEVVTPEIMEDGVKMMFLAYYGISNDLSIDNKKLLRVN